MSFGGSVQAMIDSIKLNARPKRDVFSKDSLDYRNGENADPKEIQDSMDFRKMRLSIAKRRSRIIWLVILGVCVFFIVIFPYL